MSPLPVNATTFEVGMEGEQKRAKRLLTLPLQREPYCSLAAMYDVVHQSFFCVSVRIPVAGEKIICTHSRFCHPRYSRL